MKGMMIYNKNVPSDEWEVGPNAGLRLQEHCIMKLSGLNFSSSPEKACRVQAIAASGNGQKRLLMIFFSRSATGDGHKWQQKLGTLLHYTA